jgi:EmrB/QacA subfamily drug resistance transporter
VLSFGLLMWALDLTVTNVAINRLEHDLRGSVASVQWVLSAYLLAVAAVLPVSGWTARRFGARRVYIASLALFTAGSALCACAGSIVELVGFRVIQGAAGGMIVPTSQLLCAETAGPGQMGYVMSRISAVTALGTVLGPLVGGVLLSSLGWRWIFLINVPIGVIGTVATIRLLPEIPARADGRFDLLGLVFLSIGVPAVMFGLVNAGTAGSLSSVETLVPLGVGVGLVLGFVHHARRTSRPLLDLRVYRQRAFAAGSLSLCLLNVAWFAVLIVVPLYLQQVRQCSAAVTGLLIGLQGLGTMVGMWLIGQVSADRGRHCGLGGAVLFIVASAPLALSGRHTSFWVISAAMVVEGIGGGLAWVAATAASYAELRGTEIFDASPLVAVSTRIGACAGTATAAIVLQHEIAGGRLVAGYDTTFWLVVGLAVLPILPYLFLVDFPRSRRRHRSTCQLR